MQMIIYSPQASGHHDGVFSRRHAALEPADRWAGVAVWQQGLTLGSVICRVSAAAAEDTNLWRSHHIVSPPLSRSQQKTSICFQGIARLPRERRLGSTATAALPLPPPHHLAAGWLLPEGGNENGCFSRRRRMNDATSSIDACCSKVSLE